ncbi:MAG: thioredoxin [Saprospiraceae bacterium]|nr:thioredoxin [Saprospiraceae bacterium]
MAFQFTDSNFADTALKGGVSVIDFWAEWCGPCRLIGPIIEELATQYDGKATIGKVNVDENPEISMKYSIRSIPTILILKDGEVVDKQVGLTTKAALEAKFSRTFNHRYILSRKTPVWPCRIGVFLLSLP